MRHQVSEVRLFELESELTTAPKIGTALASLKPHFSRALKLFTAAQRKKIFEHVYRFYAKLDDRFPSKQNFAKDVLFQQSGEDLDPDYAARSIVDGRSPEGLSQIICETVLNEFFDDTNTDVIFRDMIEGALGKNVFSPEHAAAVVSCVQQNELRIKAFARDAEVVLADAELLNVKSQSRKSERALRQLYARRDWWTRLLTEKREETRLYRNIAKTAEELNEMLPKLVESHSQVLQHQATLFRPENLCDAFGLELSEGGIYIPIASRIVVAKSIEQVIRGAERDRSALMNLSPRGFEEFMATLFKGLGFEVELTASTRDGGADLICLKDLHGIPFRLAVEVKRYKEGRPVTVQLIRSFVGSNRQFNANRLLYVTTSEYTKPAEDYATSYCSNLLSLKSYEHIQEWCRNYLANPPHILGANANILA